MSKYTQYKAQFWREVQMNAGILVRGFNPENGNYTGIVGATSNGITFNPNPTYEDFGADVDNVPPNTKQLKRLKYYDPVLSGTFRTIDPQTVADLCPGKNNSGTIVPGSVLTDSMFKDVTLIADYSDVNADSEATGAVAGYVAVTIHNALNTKGYQWKTNKDGKGEFSFEFHGHYDLDAPDTAPYTIYVKEPTRPATLALLTVTSAAGTNAGDSKITVTGHTLGSGESYKYQTAVSTAPTVDYGDTIGINWTALTSGNDITPEAGHTKIAVVLVNSSNKAIGYGSATIVTNTGS